MNEFYVFLAPYGAELGDRYLSADMDGVGKIEAETAEEAAVQYVEEKYYDAIDPRVTAYVVNTVISFDTEIEDGIEHALIPREYVRRYEVVGELVRNFRAVDSD